MLKHYLKRAPTLIVIGVTSYAIWPSLFPENGASPASSPAKPPAVAKAGGQAGGDPARNPFLLVGADVAKAGPAAKDARASTKSSTRPEPAAGPTERAVEEDRMLLGLTLGGTFVDGPEQVAIINGKIYGRGESLRKLDGSPLPYSVAEVRKDAAVLRRGARTFVLGFPDVPRVASSGLGARSSVAKKAAPDPARPPVEAALAASKKDARPRARGDSANSTSNSNPATMILQLLSSLGGSAGGAATSVEGSASGPSGVAINPATISAGLDALMGKYDNIGREGGATP